MNIDLGLEGKVAIVTGSGGGIGREIALSLANEGVSIVVNDIGVSLTGDGGSLQPAEETCGLITQKGGKAISDNNSVTTWDSAKKIVENAMDNFGKIDIVVNNAGILRDTIFHKMDPKDWNEVIDVNLNGSFRFTKAVIPHMMKSGGSIINMSSDAGIRSFENFYADAYTASKSALVMLTKAWAVEYAKDKIRVNAMCPGVVLTENVKKNLMLDESVVEMFKSNIPAGGITDAEKMAQQVLYLCSPAASVITGDMLIADGGEWLVGNNFYQIGKKFFDE